MSKKREIVLKPEEVRAILAEAKKQNQRDYLILKTMTIGDFRIGEVIGSEPREWDRTTRKWAPAEPNVKGFQIPDLRDDGIWVRGKGQDTEKLIPLPSELIAELQEFIGERVEGMIFDGVPFQSRGFTNHLRSYARKAGLVDWELVHPHRFRHFTTTQVARKYGVLAARDIARHKNVATTNRYISELDPEEKRKIIEAQQDLIT